MKNRFLFTLFIICSNLYSQDSLKVKTFNHDIGFNTVSLVKQLISNNPSSTLPQLPYALFYNLYYKNIVGFRLGLGLTTSTTETEISGQTEKRTTKKNTQDLRLGLSYNYIKTKRLVANVFGDYVYNQNKTSTINTSTVQTFPDPVSTLTVEGTDKTIGKGAEVGLGLKYNILKHLSVYTEVPLVFVSKQTTSETKITNSGITDKTKTSVHDNSFQIILPTTIYLVLTF